MLSFLQTCSRLIVRRLDNVIVITDKPSCTPMKNVTSLLTHSYSLLSFNLRIPLRIRRDIRPKEAQIPATTEFPCAAAF